MESFHNCRGYFRVRERDYNGGGKGEISHEVLPDGQ